MLIIDRFEENIAVIETDESTINIPIKYLPRNANEGDVIKLVIDKDTTETRKKRINKLAENLFEE